MDRVLIFEFDEREYKASVGFCSGNNVAIMKDEKPEGSICAYQQAKSDRFTMPWILRTIDVPYEIIVLKNNSWYPTTVDVNRRNYKADAKSIVVVPESLTITKQFVSLCRDKGIPDLHGVNQAYGKLFDLTFNTGINAFMEIV